MKTLLQTWDRIAWEFEKIFGLTWIDYFIFPYGVFSSLTGDDELVERHMIRWTAEKAADAWNDENTDPGIWYGMTAYRRR